MIGRALLVGGVLATVAGLTVTGTGRAEGPGTPPASSPPLPSMILNLLDEPGSVKSREKSFIESMKRDVAAPKPSMEDWEPQPDGSMRNKRSGVRLIVRNPCPPGDIEHELALAAYNRATAGKPRR